MVTRRDVGSWLEPRRSASGDAEAYPGQRLGRPADGPRSIAGLGRRLAALAVDWVLCLVIARGLLAGAHLGSFAPLLVLFVENLLLVGTVGTTVGHRLLGLRVESVEGAAPGPVRAAVRSLLLCLAVPPLLWDADQRGLHDRLAGTLIARAGG